MIHLLLFLSITLMTAIFTSFSNELSSNYVLANNFPLSKLDNDNKNGQHYSSYYSLFSDLSRNFTSTLSKFKNSNNTEGAKASAGPGGASASAGGITVTVP